MPTQVGGMYVGLTAEFQQYQAAFDRATTTTEQSTARMRRATELTARSVSSLERSMAGFSGSNGAHFGSLLAAGRAFENMSSRVSLLRGTLIAATGAFAGFAGALTTNIVARYADSYVNLNNQVLAVSKSSAEARAAFGGIAETAERSRSSLESTTLLFSRISKASPDMKATDVLRYVETIQKAMQLGGATAQEARSAAIQFSQAIASNRLGGEEFRAIMETPLGMELAKGLGVSIGKLREMSIEGKLTAQVVLGALSNAAAGIDKKFSTIAISLGQALTVADNKLTAYVGATDQAYGVTRNLGAAILAFGNNLSTIMPMVAAVGGLIAANLGSRLLAAPVRGVTSGFSTELKQRRDDLKALQAEARAASHQLVEAGLMRSRAGAASLGDQAQYASPATLSALKREEYTLTKLEAERLALIEKQKKIQGDISSVTATMSPRAVALAEKQAKAEAAVADGMKAQAEAKQRITQATTRETAALGMNAVTGAGKDAVTSARRERVSAERELQKALADTTRQQRTAASAAEQISTMTTAAEQRAVQQRIDLLRKEGDVRRQLGVNYVMRQGQTEDVGALRAGAYQEGAARNRETLRGADANLRTAAEGYRRIGSEVALASQRATAGSVALSMLRNSWMGLIGALGGGWGIAVTAGIAGLGYLAGKSMESAEQIRRAKLIIERYQDEAATDPNAGRNAARQARIGQIDRQIEALRQEEADVTARMRQSGSSLASGARVALAPLFDLTTGAELPVQRQINALVAEMKSGSLTFDAFTAKLRDLGVSQVILDQIAAAAGKIPAELLNGSVALDRIRAKIDELDGKKATVTVDIIAGGLQRFSDQESKDIAEYLRQQKRDLEANRAAAGGDKMPLYRLEAEKAAQTAGRPISTAEIEDLAKYRIETDKLQENTAKAKREANSASKAYEKLSDALARLSAEAKGSRLLDIDRDVLERAKGMKFKASDMEAYAKGAETGDFRGVNSDLMKLRGAMSEKASGSMYRDLIQEYGTASQLSREFAQRQAELNDQVAKGTISASQAATEFGKYVSSFGQYSWVTDISSAIGTFAGQAVSDFSNVKSAAVSMINTIKQALINSLITKPITNWITGTLGGMIGGGGAGAPLDLLAAGVHHSGSPDVGRYASAARLMPAGAFSAAPRYHSGLMPGELPAILMRGEAVLNQQLTGRVSNTMSGLASAASSRGGDTFQVTVNGGSSGNAAQDKSFAEQVGRQVKTAVRSIMAEEIYNGKRPGGVLRDEVTA